MICDWDDFTEDNNRLDLLAELKRTNPLFKCTVFAIPSRCSDAFLLTVPDWVELAVHGWFHGDPPTDGGECKDWERGLLRRHVICWNNVRTFHPTVKRPFAKGFKAPGWQISDGCYMDLLEAGWWCADKAYNDDRRPHGLLVHRDGDGDHLHGHIQNVCGNGLEETFADTMARVRSATSFQFISEVVQPWKSS